MDRNCFFDFDCAQCSESLSVRRAWIEITSRDYISQAQWVALRKESVDRNLGEDVVAELDEYVALRKESVDRN